MSRTFVFSWVSERGNSDSGAILAIISLVVAVVIGISGLAIDSTLASTGRLQQRHTAEYIALASLRMYHQLATDPVFAADPIARLVQTKTRAEGIAGVNFSLTDSFLQHTGQVELLGPYQSGGSLIDDGPSGKITPGVWHFSPPLSCAGETSPCPCDLVGNWAGPCFRELDFDDPAQQVIIPNAFRAELKLRDDSPLQTIFSRVLGRTHMSYSSIATAAIVPTHGIFLVDLSRSSTMETHHPYELFGDLSPGEFAYKLINMGCSATSHANPCNNNVPVACLPPFGGMSTTSDCTFAGGVIPGLYSALYNYSCPTEIVKPNRAGAMTSNLVHFRDDYQCYEVSYQDGVQPVVTEDYLVDAYTCQISDPTNPGFCPNMYQGGEPLSTMLQGLNYALNLVEARGVPGDLMGAIGFDQSATIDIRQFPPSSPTDPAFQTLKRITDIDGQTPLSMEERFQDHFFFPRVDSSSNYPSALQQALVFLQSLPNSQSAENFVVMMGDGLTYCTSDGACGNDEASYLNSYQETEGLILNQYAPNNVKFHFIIDSPTVGPHTLLATSFLNPGKCMDEDEARLHNPPVSLVDPQSYSSPLLNSLRDTNPLLRTHYFRHPNKFYELVRETDGIWGPLRPCLMQGGNCVDLRTSMDLACAASATGYGIIPLITDNASRLDRDPAGRDKRTQLQAYIDKILERNPYILVE